MVNMPEVPRKPHVSFALDGEVLDRVNNLNDDHFVVTGKQYAETQPEILRKLIQKGLEVEENKVRQLRESRERQPLEQTLI